MLIHNINHRKLKKLIKQRICIIHNDTNNHKLTSHCTELLKNNRLQILFDCKDGVIICKNSIFVYEGHMYPLILESDISIMLNKHKIVSW